MKIICVGRNYLSHIKELNNIKNNSPVIFLKPETSIIQKNQPFFIPDFSNEIHHEVELIVKINKLGKSILPKFSHKYYDEISLGIDFTARDLQNNLKLNSLPWEKCKSFDNSALIGKWINKDNFNDINDINFQLIKNDKIIQKGNSSEMIWNIDELISEISRFFTLKIGDIIFTGTPKGVGKVNIDDFLLGSIEGEQLFSIKIK